MINQLNVQQIIIDFCNSHNRNESLLYNNRLYFMYINPSELIKSQYEINRQYILNKFK